MKNHLLPNKYIRVLFWITIINIAVLFIRNAVLGNSMFNFLIWNLFLGFLPLFVAYLIERFYARINKYLLWFGSLVWLLFYPNAPYMISDLMHVNMDNQAVLYDTLIIFSFAMLSLFYGFLSLKLMYGVFKKISGQRLANTAIAASLLLSSLGFYMGRVLRFNSWDAFTHPFKVLKEVWGHLWPIGDNWQTYVVMLLFGGIQWMLLIMMKDVNSIKGNFD